MNNYQELTINSLDYPEIRDNLISFLQGQRDNQGNQIYQDYNFQASGISALINLLSYNTHYLGYYVKMLLNESFIDSAVRRESLFSKAKLTGYVPKGRTSSRIDIKLQIQLSVGQQPLSRSILIPKGTSFSGANTNADQRTFYTIDDAFVKNITDVSPGVVAYTSDTITVYEGKFQEWRFSVDSNLMNQRYIIRDESIDTTTLRVVVYPEGSVDGEDYLLATNALNTDPLSPIFYLSTNEEGLFEIVFGNNVFGKLPSHKSLVVVNYMSSNGESGNGCKSFVFNAPSQDIPTENNIGNWEDFQIVLDSGSISSGGTEIEDVDSLRNSIPYHYKRQQRIVTASDYRTVLLGEFRNIDSINVWGGEDNYIKDYGKVYLSVKPKFSNKLTATAKNSIKEEILKKYCVIGMEPVFVDPEFVDVSVTIYAKVDLKRSNKSAGQFEKQIIDNVLNYNTEVLNVFENQLSDVQMLDKIMQDRLIKSCYSKKTLSKNYILLYASGIENLVLIGNPLNNGVTSSTFNYGNVICYFKDDIAGNIYIHRKSNNAKYLIKKFGYVDYKRGIIHFTFPEFAFMTEDNYGASGIIKFYAIPTNPDIETYLNNIVRITSIRVIINA